jgi:hypothetical protein
MALSGSLSLVPTPGEKPEIAAILTSWSDLHDQKAEKAVSPYIAGRIHHDEMVIFG